MTNLMIYHLYFCFYRTFKPLISVPDYFPPMEIRDAIKDDFIYEKLMKTSNEFREYVRNEKILQPQTIGQTLTTLLHIEDMDTIKEYLDLMQQNVSLRGFDHNYNIKVGKNWISYCCTSNGKYYFIYKYNIKYNDIFI